LQCRHIVYQFDQQATAELIFSTVTCFPVHRLFLSNGIFAFNKFSFSDIENEMINLVKNGEHISLFGDFNAKSGKLSDYAKPNEELLDIFDLSEDIDLISLKIIWRKLKNNPQEKYPYMYVLLRDHLYPLKREEFIDCFIQDNRLTDICEMTNLLDIQHKNGQQVTVENINSVVDQIGKLYDDFGDFVLIIHETVIQCALKFTTCFIKLVTINIVLEQIINFSSFVKMNT
jgi:hypothetical protein